MEILSPPSIFDEPPPSKMQKVLIPSKIFQLLLLRFQYGLIIVRRSNKMCKDVFVTNH